MDAQIKIFSGNAHPALANEICEYLEVAPGDIKVTSFADGESYCQLNENVRGTDTFLIQPTGPPVNQNLM